MVAAAVVTFYGSACGAHEPDATGSLEVARPIGDTYNERTSDGDAYPQSLGVRARLARERYTVVLDYRRNVYLTESHGSGTLTRYARIEGGTGTVTPFLARESSFEARFERTVGGRSFAVGLGVLRTWTNYHYPSLSGIGVGIEHPPSGAPGLRPFGSVFYYPAASGTYRPESQPAATVVPAFRIVKMDYGVVLRSAHGGLYVVAGYGNEFRRGNGLPAEIRFVRSDPYLALGISR